VDVKNWFHIFLQVQNAPGLTTMLHAQKDGQITDWNAKRLPPTKPASLHIFKSLRRFGWPPLPWQGLCSERLSFALDSIAGKKKAEIICEVNVAKAALSFSGKSFAHWQVCFPCLDMPECQPNWNLPCPEGGS
jgi:hypothetical protein